MGRPAVRLARQAHSPVRPAAQCRRRPGPLSGWRAGREVTAANRAGRERTAG